jgi:hypothetical protein
MLSRRLGKTNSITTEVIDGEISSEEDVSNNPKRTTRDRDVETLERADASATSIENVIASLEGVLLAVESEGKLRELGDLVTGYSVLSVPTLRSTNLSIEHLSDIRRSSDEGGASIDGGASVLKLENLITESNRLELNLPISLATNGNVIDLASVVVGVNATKDGLAWVFLRVTDTEREDRFVEKTLVEEFVEGRSDVIDRNRVIGKTEDTIELSKSEGKTRLLQCFGKQQRIYFEIANGEGIL